MNATRLLVAAGLLLTFSSVPSAPAQAQETAAQIQALVAKQSPAIVTVRAVLKIEMKGVGAGAESRTEMQGVVVDPSGLIMISNIPYSTGKLMEMMGIPEAAAADAPKITPTDFQVIFERESKEYPAFLAASDTTLGLTFLRVEDLGGRVLTSVDFANAPTPALGDPVIALARLSKGYDYAPYYESARVSGTIVKPRPALMLDGSASEMGLPVFTLAGDPVGVLTSVAAGVSPGDSNEAMSMKMMMRMFGGGGSRPGVFVVPGSAVAPIIAQAQARAVELAAERAKTPPVAPAK